MTYRRMAHADELGENDREHNTGLCYLSIFYLFVLGNFQFWTKEKKI